MPKLKRSPKRSTKRSPKRSPMSRMRPSASAADKHICQKCGRVDPLEDIDIDKLCKIIHELLMEEGGTDLLTEKFNNSRGLTHVTLNTADGRYNCKLSNVLFCVVTFIQKYKGQIESVRDKKKSQFDFLMAKVVKIIEDNKHLLSEKARASKLLEPLKKKGETAAKEIGDGPVTIRNCKTCGNTNLNKHLLNCGCKKVSYCDKECQRADWKRHKEEHGERDSASKP